MTRLPAGLGRVEALDADDGSSAPACDRPEKSGARRAWAGRAVIALQLLGAALWLGLVCWRSSRVPGMSMDEGWFIATARGEWPTANPLSGMTSYTAQFPILILRAFGPSAGLPVLRGASVAAHAALLSVLALLLRDRFTKHALAGWALPVVATCPVWLISVRIGIEVTMFNALFVLAGLYFFTRGGRWWAFAGGLSWGLAVYNHLLGLWGVVAVAVAWLLVYRRWRDVAWAPSLAGFAVGLAPRLLAVAVYDNAQLVGTAASMSLWAAIADLRWTPRMLWDTLDGRTVYLRYVGRVASDIAPYWLGGLGVLLPWGRAWRQIPRAAGFALAAVLLCCIITTLGAPYLESRYLLLPVIGVPLLFVLLGASAIERNPRWGYLVRPLAALLVAGNLYYALQNFYLPWYRHELAISSFRVGERSPSIGSWHFLPKDALARALRDLQPAPEQIVMPFSLQLPLQAMRNGAEPWPRLVEAGKANPKLRSMYLDYRSARFGPRHCTRLGKRKVCFVDPVIVDEYFVLYRGTG